MQIKYKSKKMEKICTDAKSAQKVYGNRMAELIHQRIDQLLSMDTVEMLIKFRVGRCHALTENRKGQYAMDLEHPYRLVFTKEENEVQIAMIIEITDYH